MQKIVTRFVALVLTIVIAVGTGTVARNVHAAQDALWIAGDLHTHTWLTDGRHLQQDVVANAFEKYGLGWMANSEHGGAFQNDPNGKLWDEAVAVNKIKLAGDKAPAFKDDKGEHATMWRWQSLTDFSWPILFGGKNAYGEELPGLQSKYNGKVLVQGVEWNVPSHEHASVGIINQKDPKAIATFEYLFDGNDKDASKADLKKQNSKHADAVAGVTYLQTNFAKNSYVVINHPSRKQLYSAADIRDLHNAGPDVMVGLEGMPGHQKEAGRGGYNSMFYTDAEKKNADQAKTDLARTYGGADIMLSKVGGLMDSLWGEGRRFWVFVNADFHSAADDADFWPGEYAKTYYNVKEVSQTAIVDSMRAGNLFIVHGDLINALDFKAASGGTTRAMGDELTAAKGSDVTVTIRFKSPEKNVNGDKVVVDHIDLIVGDVTGKIDPASDQYKSNTNSSTKVVATFTSKDWKADADGFLTITYTLKLDKNQYIRLRGTNLGANIENQTKDGNPLNDDLLGKNDKSKAWADLWFYSNPIFITAK